MLIYKGYVMPKFISFTILAAIFVALSILTLPYMLPSRALATYNDNELREVALSRGMLPNPRSYEELITLKDNVKVLTREKITLGKMLFFDTNLSQHSNVSCASCHVISKNRESKREPISRSIKNNMEHTTNCIACHQRDESGTDRLASAIGDNKIQNPLHLNTMTILNTSLAKHLTWSGEVESLEDEIANSIVSPYKMNLQSKDLVQRLKKIPQYIEAFDNAFAYKHNINFENIQDAIATYVHTLLTRGTYDEFLDGNNSAISSEAKRGLSHFINLGCKGCHTGRSVGGQTMERFPLKDFFTIESLGYSTPYISSRNFFPFENIGNFLGKENKHLFRVPILRNVTKTSPYFHNGSVAKIEEAIAIMGKHQLGILLSEQEIDEIIAFLKTLEGDIVIYHPENI
jgi:cytochrome c peroxidase